MTSRYLFWGLLSILLLLNFGYKIVQVFSYAPDLGGFERNVIWGIQQILSGHPLYSNPAAGSFSVVQYMPFYYYLLAGIGKVTGIDPQKAHSVYVLARGFNLICCLLSSFLLFRMARISFRVPVRIALPVALLGFLWMEKFALSGRPDSLKALLFQILVFVLLQFPEWRKRTVVGISLLISTLAFFTKQDGLVFCAILPLVLFLQKDWKAFFAVSCLQLVLIAGLAGAFQSATNGDFFLNVFGGLHNGISLSWFVGAFGNYFSWMAVLFALALVLGFEFLFESNWKLNALGAAFCFSFFPQLLFSLKFGSGSNYFLECTLISLLLLSIFLSRMSLEKHFVLPFTPNLLATGIFALLFLVPSFHWFTGVFVNREGDLKTQYQNQKEVVHWMKTHSGKAEFKALVLIQKQWEDHLTTLLSDHAVCPMRDVSDQIFEAKGKSGFDPLQSEIADGKVEFLVSDSPQLPAFLKLDYSKYRMETEVAGYYLFTTGK